MRTLPLVLPPRVLHLYDPLLLLPLLGGDVHLLHVQHGVRVLRNQAQVAVSIVVLGRACQQVVELEVGVDEGPGYVGVDA